MIRCLEWKGAKNRGGYGIFSRNGKHISAHREMYKCTYGPIPEGLMICHRCNNRACINPDHLYAGTAYDNARDRVFSHPSKEPTPGKPIIIHFEIPSALFEKFSKAAKAEGMTKSEFIRALIRKDTK